MKLLMFFCDTFSFKPAVKNLENTPESHDERHFEKVLLAFIQAEEQDEDRSKSVEKKLLNYLKWAARNNDSKNVVMHSFAHLSESKASADFTKSMLDRIQKKLQNVDYQCEQTPFGYFLDLNIQAPGYSMARIFRSF